MKTFQDIYRSISNGIKKRIGIDVAPNTVLDYYVLASSDAIAEAHQAIEDNKTPHIYTGLKGTDIDKFGMLVNCPRYENEDDASYLYRCITWTLNNQAANRTAITNAISNLNYSSNANYVPKTEGLGSATIFFIPKVYDEETIKNAKSEIEDRIYLVVSPDSYINIKESEPIAVKVAVYGSYNGDEELIKENIEKQIKEYINSIPIGDMLSYGAINKIGINEQGVEFFNTTHIYLDGQLMTALNTMQGIDTKFLFEDIIWGTVNS